MAIVKIFENKKIGVGLAGLTGAALAISISAAQISALLLLILWAARSSVVIKNERDFGWLDAAILAFFTWGVITTAFNHSTPFLRSLRAHNAVLLFYVFWHGMTEEEAAASIKWFLIGCAVQGFWGLLQHFSQIHNLLDEHRYEVPVRFAGLPQRLIHRLADWQFRSVGFRSHPLTYAEGLAPSVFLFPMMLSSGPQKLRTRGFIFLGTGLVLGGILLSQARGVWVGLGCGIAVAAAFSPRGSWLQRFALAMMVAGVLVVGLSPNARGRLMSIVTRNQGDLPAQQSKSIRLNLWRQSVNSIKAHPLAGIGLEGVQFEVEHPVYHTKDMWSETHSIFLQMTVETGVIGFLLFLWVLALVVKQIFKTPPLYRIPFLSILLTFLVMGLTESWFNDKEVAMIFWWLMGCVIHFQKKKEAWA